MIHVVAKAKERIWIISVLPKYPCGKGMLPRGTLLGDGGPTERSSGHWGYVFAENSGNQLLLLALFHFGATR